MRERLPSRSRMVAVESPMSRGRTQRPGKGPKDQSGCRQVRHLRGDRRRPGSGPLVLSRRQGLFHGRQIDFGIRQSRQRCALRHHTTLRQPRPAGGDAGSRVQSTRRATGRHAGRKDRILRLRRYRSHARLVPFVRRPRLARRPFPGSSPGAAVRSPHPHRNAGRLHRQPAGGRRPRRRQPHLRRLCLAPGPHRLDEEPDGRPRSPPDRDRPDQVLRPRRSQAWTIAS